MIESIQMKRGQVLKLNKTEHTEHDSNKWLYIFLYTYMWVFGNVHSYIYKRENESGHPVNVIYTYVHCYRERV